MGATTDTWLIPYPLDTDTFCDGYLFTQQIAERVDAIMDNFDVELARVELIPLARVSVTIPQNDGASGEEINWKNVDFDTTGNIVNLNLDTEFITVQGGEYRLVGGAASFFFGVGTAGTAYALVLTGGSDRQVVQRDSAPAGANLALNFIDESTNPEFFGLVERHIGTAPAGTPTMTTLNAYMWYLWLGDL